MSNSTGAGRADSPDRSTREASASKTDHENCVFIGPTDGLPMGTKLANRSLVINGRVVGVLTPAERVALAKGMGLTAAPEDDSTDERASASTPVGEIVSGKRGADYSLHVRWKDGRIPTHGTILYTRPTGEQESAATQPEIERVAQAGKKLAQMWIGTHYRDEHTADELLEQCKKVLALPWPFGAAPSAHPPASQSEPAKARHTISLIEPWRNQIADVLIAYANGGYEYTGNAVADILTILTPTEEQP